MLRVASPSCCQTMYSLTAWDSIWNVMAHGDAQEGKWKGNWPMECVASTLHTTSEHDVSSITTADAHNSAASSRLNWRPPVDLNGLVRFAERRNLVSARVPSHFNWPLLTVVIRLNKLQDGNVTTFTKPCYLLQGCNLPLCYDHHTLKSGHKVS